LSCEQVKELIYLDVIQTSQVERHLEQCEECGLIYRSQVALRSSLQDASFYYHAPADLKDRITSTLQREQKEAKNAQTGTSSWITSW